jgi:cyclopropane fatty-acyl-phospholipid synthase-like methyltransferase
MTAASADTIRNIVGAYDSHIVKLYALIRFHILRQRFLEEIGQYLPATGRVLDLGCGFGLFMLYFAEVYPGCEFFGADLNRRRIGQARRVADKLRITNVEFSAVDVRDYPFTTRFDAVYMLDIVHHIPPEAVEPLLTSVRNNLSEGGVLLIKDVRRRPAYKRWFTHALDKLMDYKTPVNYWPVENLRALVASLGFSVHVHTMVDYLPYPHVLYVCRAKAR